MKHEYKTQAVTWHSHQIADGLMRVERDGWEVFQMLSTDTQFGYSFTLILRRVCKECGGSGLVQGKTRPDLSSHSPCWVCSK